MRIRGAFVSSMIRGTEGHMGRSLYLRILTATERRNGMVGADLTRRWFRAVDLSDCCFAYAECGGVVFEDVDLRGAEFSGACLERARFVRCDLTGASFATADVRDAQFITCSGLSPQQEGALAEREARIYTPLPGGANRTADAETEWVAGSLSQPD